MHADTAPWAEKMIMERLRTMTPAQKLARATDLTLGAMKLAEAGLRSRYPNAGDEEIRRRMADLTLGPDLAKKWLGPIKVTESDNS
jgi:hypothetical protein